jgi:penicillin-binding protein 1A
MDQLYTWPDETIQTGIAVTDVKTGALVAVGAGRNRKGELSYNYATMINRHPGSTAKPIFDYGPAIEYLNYSTGTTIVDDQYTYSNGAYIRNWDNSYKGIMTVKTALAASRNIPALTNISSFVSRSS